jgi:hypothetical protein
MFAGILFGRRATAGPSGPFKCSKSSISSGVRESGVGQASFWPRCRGMPGWFVSFLRSFCDRGSQPRTLDACAAWLCSQRQSLSSIATHSPEAVAEYDTLTPQISRLEAQFPAVDIVYGAVCIPVTGVPLAVSGPLSGSSPRSHADVVGREREVGLQQSHHCPILLLQLGWRECKGTAKGIMADTPTAVPSESSALTKFKRRCPCMRSRQKRT